MAVRDANIGIGLLARDPKALRDLLNREPVSTVKIISALGKVRKIK